MTAKMIAAILTFLLNASAGVVLFFFLLLSMNGFSESDANYGFGAYIALAVLVTLAMSALAALGVHLLQRKNFGGVAAVLLSVLLFSIAGSLLKIACAVAGVLVADFVRVNY